MVKTKKSPFSSLSIFKNSFNTRSVIDVTEASDEEDLLLKSLRPRRKKVRAVPATPEVEEEINAVSVEEATSLPDVSQLRYVSQNPQDTEILPPEQTPDVRINPDAPGCFKGMVAAKRAGNKMLAKQYAEQCIRYQQDFLFEARDYAQLMGKALTAQGVIDEDDWDGVTQMMDYELAETRKELGTILKPTHDVAMRRIVPDSKQEVEIFYFFTLNCSWCRYMSADAERLWRIAQSDPRIKMTGILINDVRTEWLEEYRDYTGMTMPIMYGQELAKQFDVKFVPALVVVAPNTDKAYLKTGQQNFERMYEFVRTVQGLPATVTAQFKQLLETPIGQKEIKERGVEGSKIYVARHAGSGARAVKRKKRRLSPEELVGRF